METFKISVSSGILSVTYKCDIYTIICQLNTQARTLCFSNTKGWYLQHLPGHLLTPVEKHHSQCVGGDGGTQTHSGTSGTSRLCCSGTIRGLQVETPCLAAQKSRCLLLPVGTKRTILVQPSRMSLLPGYPDEQEKPTDSLDLLNMHPHGKAP